LKIEKDLTLFFFFARPWEEATISDAYSALVDEIKLGPSTPGGKVDFRRSLTLSLLFKFHLLVLRYLKEKV